MKKNLKLLSCAVLILTLIISVFPFTVAAAATIGETVNLQRADKNNRGEGYYFHNPSNTLTLSGISIDTTDTYGMKVKKDVTIVLEGQNYIKASEIALYCPGTFTIKGSGSLTLVSGDRGIVLNTNDTSDKLRLLEGTLDITSVNEAISIPNGGAALAGGKVKLSTTNSENAIAVRSLTISGGCDFTSDAPIYASYKLGLTAAKLSITTSSQAIKCDGQLTMLDMAIKAGASGQLSEVDEYADQACIETVSTFKSIKPSIIFGGSVPVVVDYIILAVAVLAVAALIVVPILSHRAKIKRMEEAGLAGMSGKNKKKAR